MISHPLLFPISFSFLLSPPLSFSLSLSLSLHSSFFFVTIQAYHYRISFKKKTQPSPTHSLSSP